jgi:hypothetical protein
MTPTALTRAVIDLERHVAAGGWDQSPRLFALVPTADLLAREPGLAEQLGTYADQPAGLTSVEQEDLPHHASLEELLAGIAWPAEVLGAALVVERLMLPADVEAGMPRQDSEALEWLAGHPQRQEMRMAVGVLRDGARECALRLRSHDADDAVLSGAELVPGLTAALAGTLAD